MGNLGGWVMADLRDASITLADECYVRQHTYWTGFILLKDSINKRWEANTANGKRDHFKDNLNLSSTHQLYLEYSDQNPYSSPRSASGQP